MAVVAVAFLAGAAPAEVTFETLTNAVFNQACVSCHGAHGYGQFQRVNPPTAANWCNGLKNGSTASNSGKLRVHPYQPWASFLLDKLNGHVKTGENSPMPEGGHGYVHYNPGHVDAIAKWILAGAPCDGGFGLEVLRKDKPQPLFEPPLPDEGRTVIELRPSDPCVVKGSAWETECAVDLVADNVADGFVEQVRIFASPGTEYVVLAREGDETPLVVSRGESLDLDLRPHDAGIAIGANQPFRIRQRINNEYWVAPPTDPENPTGWEGPYPYFNRTTGEVVVHLYLADEVAHVAEPLIDTTGTSILFTPPQQVGTSGGVWSGSAGATGALVGVWGDRRLLSAALADPAGQSTGFDPVTFDPTGALPLLEGLTDGYVEVTGPLGAIGYTCVHNNGRTNQLSNQAGSAAAVTHEQGRAFGRPLRSGCEATANVPSGLPGLVGDGAPDCRRSHATWGNDCAGVGAGFCRPANLTGGDGVNDGRCTLVGLAW